MSRVRAIAALQLRLFGRARLAVVALVLLGMLSAIAAVTGASQASRMAADRAAAQMAANTQFANQPDRHPHRMVHYGTYALRPLGPLAAFDPGVDAFAGSLIYLEGHRQNATTLGAARESSGLIRFGQLTPAFVLRVLVPLLLVFIGFAMIVAEREAGLLRLQLTHGASTGALIAGKALALGLVAGLAALPALAALAHAVVQAPQDAAVAALMALAALLWLALWVLGITLVSVRARSAQAALMALVLAWAVLVVLVPRVAAGVAALAYPLPTKAETDLIIHQELRGLGDSHNPNDPHFAAFKAALLKRHGVTRVEDLPFNYRGAMSTEGERLTSQLFARHAAQLAAVQLQQHRLLEMLGVVSPAIGFAQASMAGAATDLASHIAFQDAAEAHRYRLIQSLNGLHTFQVRAGDDAARNRDPIAERQSRVSARFWAEQTPFHHQGPARADRMAGMLPALAVMLLWGAALLWLLARASRQEPA
ncbi:MAG: ABC transporter permease [Alphaproteobacteria bacterium PA4]|nr:MAG: ABC transporter permease [Alphaproteobacteria bacterium PA4]